MIIVSDRERLAVVVVFRSLGINAQSTKPRVKHVADVERFGVDERPLSVGLATTTPRLTPQPAIASDQASGQ